MKDIDYSSIEKRFEALPDKRDVSPILEHLKSMPRGPERNRLKSCMYAYIYGVSTPKLKEILNERT